MTRRLAKPSPAAADVSGRDSRAYLLDMIEQLAELAERCGEAAMAIHLLAIRDAARVAERRRHG